MKKLIKNILIIAAMALFFNPLHAESGKHHDHDHGDKYIDSHVHDELFVESVKKHSSVCFHEKALTKRKIQRAARVKIWELAYIKRIPAFWLDAPIVATDKKKFKYDVEWVIQFKDNNATDKKKEIIYVFVDFYGQVTGANYIGG